jgi:type III secretory pathway lipoprotein EscJ
MKLAEKLLALLESDFKAELQIDFSKEDANHVQQLLANNDINSKVDDNSLFVDSSDLQKSKSILSKNGIEYAHKKKITTKVSSDYSQWDRLSDKNKAQLEKWLSERLGNPFMQKLFKQLKKINKLNNSQLNQLGSDPWK